MNPKFCYRNSDFFMLYLKKLKSFYILDKTKSNKLTNETNYN